MPNSIEPKSILAVLSQTGSMPGKVVLVVRLFATPVKAKDFAHFEKARVDHPLEEHTENRSSANDRDGWKIIKIPEKTEQTLAVLVRRGIQFWYTGL
jgi:hypothetical protein